MLNSYGSVSAAEKKAVLELLAFDLKLGRCASCLNDSDWVVHYASGEKAAYCHDHLHNTATCWDSRIVRITRKDRVSG